MPFIPTVEDIEAPSRGTPTSPAPIDEVRAIFAHFPDGLHAFDQMYERMVGQGRLDQSLRYIILGAAARWRSDGFIAGTMFKQAIEAGRNAQALGDLIAEAEGPEPADAEAVLLAFSKKATESAFKMIQSDVDAALAKGWTNGQIVEAVTMVSLSGYITVMCAAGGLLNAPTVEAEPWH